MTTQTPPDGEAWECEYDEDTGQDRIYEDEELIACVGNMDMEFNRQEELAEMVRSAPESRTRAIAAHVATLTAERDAALARVEELETWKPITDAQKDGKEYICIDAGGSVFQAKWWNDVDEWLQYGTDWVAPKQYLMESPARAALKEQS